MAANELFLLEGGGFGGESICRTLFQHPDARAKIVTGRDWECNKKGCRLHLLARKDKSEGTERDSGNTQGSVC